MAPIDIDRWTASISNFSKKGMPTQTEIFAWYLHEALGKDRFSTSEIGSCFDNTHLPRPANIASTLTKLAAKKPARVIRDKLGYRLSASARQDLQKTYPLRQSTVMITKLLNDLLVRVTEKHNRAYLEEALICFGHKAYRGAIIMAWNLAYSDVVDRIYSSGLDKFNGQVGTHNFRRAIVNRSDFADLKESDVIKISRAAKLISGETLKILEEKLGKRNSAAHPSAKIFTVVSAEDFISDLVENVVLNPNI
jgi:hypothetical protein